MNTIADILINVLKDFIIFLIWEAKTNIFSQTLPPSPSMEEFSLDI